MSIFDAIFNNLPYPVASGIVRGIKVFLGIVVPVLVAAVSDGSIFSGFHFIPQGYIPIIVMVAAPLAVGGDKWLRARGLEQSTVDAPISVVGNGPSTTDEVAPVAEDIPTPQP